ncbi:hypothetical protein WDU94_009040 [Cyamophila willieti]
MMENKNEDTDIEFADSTNEYVWKKKRAAKLKQKKNYTQEELFSIRLKEKIRQQMRNTQSLDSDDTERIWKIPTNHESPRNDIGLSNGFLFKSNSEEFSDSLSPKAPLAEEISFSENNSLDETFTINEDRNITFTMNEDEEDDAATLTPNSSLSDNEEFRIENIELDQIEENASYEIISIDPEMEEKSIVPSTTDLKVEPKIFIENSECQIMNESQEKIFSLHSSNCPLELEFYFQNFLIATKSDLFFLLSDFAKFMNFLLSQTKVVSPCFLDEFSEMKYYSSHYSFSMQLSLSLFLDKVLSKLIELKSEESIQNKQERAILRDEKMNFIKSINKYAVENKLKSHELFELVISTISKTLKHVENKKLVERREWTSSADSSSGCTSMVAVLNGIQRIPERTILAPASEKQHISRLGSQSDCDLPCEKSHVTSCFAFDQIKSSLFQFNGNFEQIKNNSQNYTEAKKENVFPEEKIFEICGENLSEVFQPSVELNSKCCGSENVARFVDQETQVTNVGIKKSVVCVNCGSVSNNNLFKSEYESSSTPLVPCQELLECKRKYSSDVVKEEQDVINNNSCNKHDDRFSEIQDLIEKGNSLIKKFNLNYLEILQTDNKLREGVEDLNLNQTFTYEKSDSIFKSLRNEDLKTINENDETEGSDLEPVDVSPAESQSPSPTEDMKQKKNKGEDSETMSSSTSSEQCNGLSTPTVKPILKTNIKRQHSSGSMKKQKKKNHVQFNEALNKFFDADYVILIRDDDEYDGDMIGCDCEDDYCFEDCYEEYEDYNNAAKSSHQSHQQKQKYDLCAAFEPPMEFVDQVTLSPPDGYKDCSPHHCFNQAEIQQHHNQGKNQFLYS